MAQKQYFVVLHEGRWMISLDQRHYGPFLTQRDAKLAAIDAAYEAKNESQVFVQGGQSFQADWTYGNDAYPPVG